MKVQFKDSPFKVITFLYSFFILIFAFLYTANFSGNKPISFIDAFFLSSSAASGSGLSTITPATDLSLIGKILLLIEIQIGGIGIMATFGIFLFFLSQNVSIPYQTLMSFDQNQKSLRSIKRLMTFIFTYSAIIETVGSILSFPSIYAKNGDIAHSIFISVFHSVSSYVNAGFDLFGDSLIGFSTNAFFLTMTAFLIIFGTIGFPVVYELLFNRGKKKSLFTKVNLLTHGLLLFFGTVILLVFEWKGSLANFSFIDKLSNAFFLSASARNAGFASFDLSTLTSSSISIVSILMFIGGSASSAGGGIRTTTFAVLIAKVKNILKGREDVVIFRKSLVEEDVNKAYLIFGLFFVLYLVSTILLTFIEGKSMVAVSFEVMSALSTTGLSVGITAKLTVFSKIWLSVLMSVMRIGVLSLLYSFVKPKKSHIRYKKEQIIVG